MSVLQSFFIHVIQAKREFKLHWQPLTIHVIALWPLTPHEYLQNEVMRSDTEPKDTDNAVHCLILPSDSAAAVGHVIPETGTSRVQTGAVLLHDDTGYCNRKETKTFKITGEYILSIIYLNWVVISLTYHPHHAKLQVLPIIYLFINMTAAQVIR